MKNLLTRFGLGLLASVILVAATSLIPKGMDRGQRTDGLFYEVTAIHPDAQLLTVDGESVSAEEYLYWLAYDCAYLTAGASDVDWDRPFSDGTTLGQYVKSSALERVKTFATVRRLAAEHGVTLTDGDMAALEEQKNTYIQYYGSEEAYRRQVEMIGVSEESYDSINAGYALLERLRETAATEGSSLYPSQAALSAFVEGNGYVTARLLYLPIVGLDETADAAQQALAEDYVRQLNASDDPYALLGHLAEELGIDAGSSDLTFSAASVAPELAEALAALDDNEISGVIRTSDALYVAIRRPLDTHAAAENYCADRLLRAGQNAKVIYSPLYDRIDAGRFYTGLTEKRLELAEAFTAEK